MRPTLGNYIDSINNPNGHFRTLEKVYALRAEDGNPYFTISSRIARFNVDYRGKRSLLCCFLSNQSVAKSRFKILSLDMEALKSQYLTSWEYLEKELLVFDERGSSSSCDVILQQEPDGELLDAFIRRCCKHNDSNSLRLLMQRVCDMSVEFYQKQFVHGAISPNNIIVTPDIVPVLINYRSSYVIKSESELAEGVNVDRDNICLAVLALVLYMVSYKPSLYTEFKGSMMFRRPSLRYTIPLVLNFAKRLGIEPLQNIASSLIAANDILRDRQQLNKNLLDLSQINPSSYIGDNSSSEQDNVQERDLRRNNEGIKYAAPHVDLSEFEWVSTVSDTLICVCNRNKQWHYLNKDGTGAFEKQFEMAEDFVEGRAVVMIDEYYGVIDRSGQYVIEPVCEDIVWYGDSGVLVVSLDGIYRLRNRNGELISETVYDWIGILENGLMPAKIGEKYGYINLRSETVIKFIYDDAYSFVNGIALVAKDGKEFEINLRGKIIS